MHKEKLAKVRYHVHIRGIDCGMKYSTQFVKGGFSIILVQQHFKQSTMISSTCGWDILDRFPIYAKEGDVNTAASLPEPHVQCGSGLNY